MIKMKPVLDSGAREEYDSGMRRDTQDGKPNFMLLFPEYLDFEEQPLVRLAHHMRLGAEKYGERNWEKANSEEELARFKSSALRHLLQALSGEEDENHYESALFNIMAIMALEKKIEKKPRIVDLDGGKHHVLRVDY